MDMKCFRFVRASCAAHTMCIVHSMMTIISRLVKWLYFMKVMNVCCDRNRHRGGGCVDGRSRHSVVATAAAVE